MPVSRSVLAHWVGYAAAELKPIWAVMRDELLACERLFVDETRAPVQDPGRGEVKTGYFWAIARDDRPWGGPDPPAVVYTYAPGRGAEHAISLLGGFVGVLQTDGYGACKSFARNRNGVALAHCWSHVRRKFFDLAKAGSAPIAEEALRRIGELYRVEASVRGQSPDVRQAARAKASRAVVEDLFARGSQSSLALKLHDCCDPKERFELLREWQETSAGWVGTVAEACEGARVRSS